MTVSICMSTYTEKSPSGYGLRILFTVPNGFQYDKARYYINNQKAGLEVYIAGATSKFVTVTGDTLTPGLDLQERGEQLQQVLEKFMSDEETQSFDALEKEIRAIDATLERMNTARGIKDAAPAPTPAPNSADPTVEERAAADEKQFADYVMGRVTELRAGEQNMTMSNNGAIIPTTIANKIIKAVKDRCPILSGATIYNAKGTLKVPVWGKANTTHDFPADNFGGGNAGRGQRRGKNVFFL